MFKITKTLSLHFLVSLPLLVQACVFAVLQKALLLFSLCD